MDLGFWAAMAQRWGEEEDGGGGFCEKNGRTPLCLFYKETEK